MIKSFKCIAVLIILSASVVIPACVDLAPRAEFAPSQLSQAYKPRTSSEKIELFRTQLPTKKYSEIGTVNACCSVRTNILVDMLRQKASEMGGDALLSLDVNATGGAFASVIRYTSASTP